MYTRETFTFYIVYKYKITILADNGREKYKSLTNKGWLHTCTRISLVSFIIFIPLF